MPDERPPLEQARDAVIVGWFGTNLVLSSLRGLFSGCCGGIAVLAFLALILAACLSGAFGWEGVVLGVMVLGILALCLWSAYKSNQPPPASPTPDVPDTEHEDEAAPPQPRPGGPITPPRS